MPSRQQLGFELLNRSAGYRTGAIYRETRLVGHSSVPRERVASSILSVLVQFEPVAIQRSNTQNLADKQRGSLSLVAPPFSVSDRYVCPQAWVDASLHRAINLCHFNRQRRTGQLRPESVVKPSRLESIVKAEDPVHIFVLVHGTWTASAEWTQAGSKLVASLLQMMLLFGRAGILPSGARIMRKNSRKTWLTFVTSIELLRLRSSRIHTVARFPRKLSSMATGPKPTSV